MKIPKWAKDIVPSVVEMLREEETRGEDCCSGVLRKLLTHDRMHSVWEKIQGFERYAVDMDNALIVARCILMAYGGPWHSLARQTPGEREDFIKDVTKLTNLLIGKIRGTELDLFYEERAHERFETILEKNNGAFPDFDSWDYCKAIGPNSDTCLSETLMEFREMIPRIVRKDLWSDKGAFPASPGKTPKARRRARREYLVINLTRDFLRLFGEPMRGEVGIVVDVLFPDFPISKREIQNMTK